MKNIIILIRPKTKDKINNSSFNGLSQIMNSAPVRRVKTDILAIFDFDFMGTGTISGVSKRPLLILPAFSCDRKAVILWYSVPLSHIWRPSSHWSF